MSNGQNKSKGQVILHLSPPPSTNRIWQRGRNGQVFRSKAYTTWLRRSHIVAGNPGNVSGVVMVYVKIMGGKGWRKGRDVDNIQKPLLDFLVHCGVIEDDNWEIVRRVTVSYTEPKRASDSSKIIVKVRRVGWNYADTRQNQGTEACPGCGFAAQSQKLENAP